MTFPLGSACPTKNLHQTSPDDGQDMEAALATAQAGWVILIKSPSLAWQWSCHVQISAAVAVCFDAIERHLSLMHLVPPV
jgi:hypothetical protein